MHAAPFMGSKNSHPASRERPVKSAIKTVSIIFTYSSGQTGSSTGEQNIQGDLSASCGGRLSHHQQPNKKQNSRCAQRATLGWRELATLHIGSDINKEAQERRAISGDDERLSGWSLTCVAVTGDSGCGGGGGEEWGFSGVCRRGWGVGGWSVRKTALSGWFSYDSWWLRGAQQ